MSGTTSRLALITVDTDGDDTVDVYRLAINNHAAKLDTTALFLSGPLASRGAAGLAGRYYLATDDLTSGANGTLSYDTGSAWQDVGVPWLPAAPGGSSTVVAGQFVVAQPSSTQTLPAPVAGAQVIVVAAESTTGATPVTVAAAGGVLIYGQGMNGVASFVLGTGAASAWLIGNGTQWIVVATSGLLAPGAPTFPTLALSTARQPNAARPTFVTCILELNNAVATAFIGATSSPSDPAAYAAAVSCLTYATLSFWVPAGWYYEVSGSGTSVAIAAIGGQNGIMEMAF